jgi:hypothetical protein
MMSNSKEKPTIMCIMATDAKPTSTRIYLVPVTVDGVPGYTCMLYTNDLAVKTGVPGLMIVPFPNPTNTERLGLVDVTTTKEFRAVTKDVMDPKPKGFGTLGLRSQHTDGFSTNYAPVHEVGNYKCSVVPNLDALRSAIDWSRFTVPHDLAARLSVLDDPTLVPPSSGFVVAEAIRSVKEDGFGVVFPGHHAFFPTCHEGPATVHNYDVVCYGFNVLLPGAGTSTTGDETSLARMQTAFAPRAIWGNDPAGSAMLVRPEPFGLASRLALLGALTNSNVTGKYVEPAPGTGEFRAPTRASDLPPVRAFPPAAVAPAAVAPAAVAPLAAVAPAAVPPAPLAAVAPPLAAVPAFREPHLPAGMPVSFLDRLWSF